MDFITKRFKKEEDKKTGDITLSLKDFSRIMYLLGRLEVYMEYLKKNNDLL